MHRIDILPWSELASSEREAWRRLRAGRVELDSPFFDLAFIDAVAATRRDVRAAVVGDDGAAAAILAFQRDGLGGLAPAGAPMSDAHGFVAAAGSQVDLARLLARAGAHALQFTAAPQADPTCGPDAMGDVSHLIDFNGGPEAYEREQAASYGKAFRTLRSRRRKAAEALGEVRAIVDDRRPELLERLIAWKSSQYRRTGQVDVFAPAWTRTLVAELFERRSDGFAGRLSTLWFGDRLAAAHFGIQGADLLHWWFPSFDPELSPYSPGLLLLQSVIAGGAEIDARRIELGSGGYRFKQEFANAGRPLCSITLCRPSLAGAARAALVRTGRALSKAPVRWSDLPARAARRGYLAWTLRTGAAVTAPLWSLACSTG